MFRFSALVFFLLGAGLCSAASPNPKRGLVFLESPDPAVNSIWRKDGSPLTWYYNYMYNVSGTFASVAQDDFEFVPMYWVSPVQIRRQGFSVWPRR